MPVCYSCFKPYRNSYSFCPHCGARIVNAPKEVNHLWPGTILSDRYLIGHAVGSGGFGIIYRAWDTKLETVIAVKEFFSARIMSRSPGSSEVLVSGKTWDEFQYRKERFLAEARTMARFATHPNIPNVFEFFEENGTAYIVMEYLNGKALNDFLRERQGRIDQSFALFITKEVGNAISALHQGGVIHRDVAPDNIFICSDSKIRIKLLDLGAAKLADHTDEVVDIVLKPGFSPPEQYVDSSATGIQADVYALGATLYNMLTGSKPDESTNRQVVDTLLFPNQLDPEISGTLSNAIMKAMALDPALRFRSVEEFLHAILGEARVLPPAKEQSRRKRIRVVWIAASILLPVCIALSILLAHWLQKRAMTLDDASITVWFSQSEHSNEYSAMESVLQDFQENYPNITVNCVAYPEDDYQQALEDAYRDGSMPTLFESTGVSDDILSSAHDLEAPLQSAQAADCLFLNQYHSYYSDQTRLPLAIEVPVAYVITSGPLSVPFQSDCFSSLEEFGQTPVAEDPSCVQMLHRNLTFSAAADPSEFLNNTNNTCAVYLSSTASMPTVRSMLTNYQKKAVYYDSEHISCGFTYEWSISGGSGAEIAAAERLLTMMLGSDYQRMLMISRASDGQIPINKDCFFKKITQNRFEPIKQLYKHFEFFR